MMIPLWWAVVAFILGGTFGVLGLAVFSGLAGGDEFDMAIRTPSANCVDRRQRRLPQIVGPLCPIVTGCVTPRAGRTRPAPGQRPLQVCSGAAQWCAAGRRARPSARVVLKSIFREMSILPQLRVTSAILPLAGAVATSLIDAQRAFVSAPRTYVCARLSHVLPKLAILPRCRRVAASIPIFARFDEGHAGGIPVFRRVGIRCAAQGRRAVRARRRSGGGRPPRAGGESGRRAAARARESEGGARRSDRRRHRSHRCRTYARASQQRGAGALASGRRRLPSVAAAAASRHSCRRVDDHGRRPDCRRIGLSPGRWLGRGRDRRAGLVLRRQGRNRARAVGARAGTDGTCAAGPRRSSRCRAWRASRLSAGPALRHQGAARAPHGVADRRAQARSRFAGGHRDRIGPPGHRPAVVGARAGFRRQLGGQPDGEYRRPVRGHGAFRSSRGERRCVGGCIAGTGIRWIAHRHRQDFASACAGRAEDGHAGAGRARPPGNHPRPFP